jgi:hypothetical protein
MNEGKLVVPAIKRLKEIKFLGSTWKVRQDGCIFRVRAFDVLLVYPVLEGEIIDKDFLKLYFAPFEEVKNAEIRSQIKQEAKKRLSPKGYVLWETIKELSKENKLKLLNGISIGEDRHNSHICTAISYKARSMRFLNTGHWNHLPSSWIAVALIPELVKLKPENTEIDDQYGWFGIPSPLSAKRRRIVLKYLIELITTNNRKDVWTQ